MLQFIHSKLSKLLNNSSYHRLVCSKPSIFRTNTDTQILLTVKGMRCDLSSFSLQKHNHVFLKFALSFLFVGLTFRLLISDSFNLSSVVHTHPPLSNSIAESPLISFPIQTPDSVEFQRNQSQPSHNGNIKFIFLC